MSDAPLVLSLETATLGGSVAIARGNSVLAWGSGDPETSHSNTLLSDLNEALARAEVSLEEIDLLAAASGPGSFTGLRIGLATIKGLAATLGKPCAGVPTLYAIARAAGPSPATVALLPAGRGELFAQHFFVSDSGSVTALDEPAHLTPQRM
jgi:tRNA threonylcarbamoyladenosine biosynthesis protein TsaB